MRIVHAKFLLKVLHRYKITVTGYFLAFNFMMVYFCFTLGEYYPKFFLVISLIVSFLTGALSSMSDSTIFGFMKVIPTKAYVGFTTGTGFSGIIGSSLPIMTTIFGFNIKWVLTNTNIIISHINHFRPVLSTFPFFAALCGYSLV